MKAKLVLVCVLAALAAFIFAKHFGFPSLPKIAVAPLVPEGVYGGHVPYVPELCIGHTGVGRVTENDVKVAGGDAFQAIQLAIAKIPNCGGRIDIAITAQHVVTHQLVVPERVSLFFDPRGLYVDHVKAEAAIRFQ